MKCGFILGVYAFTFGSVMLPWSLSLSGWRANVSGIFLMAPLPILILLGMVVSQGVDVQTALFFYVIGSCNSRHPWRCIVLLSN